MGEQTNQRTVVDMVRRDDAEKLGRMRYLYEVDIRDPALYDVVINTEKLPYEAAVEVIAGLGRRPEMATTAAGAQLVADRALASRVQVALATHPETRKYRTTVEAKDGVVTLEGTAALEEAVEVARACRRARGADAASGDPPDPAVRGVGAPGRFAPSPFQPFSRRRRRSAAGRGAVGAAAVRRGSRPPSPTVTFCFLRQTSRVTGLPTGRLRHQPLELVVVLYGVFS